MVGLVPVAQWGGVCREGTSMHEQVLTVHLFITISAPNPNTTLPYIQLGTHAAVVTRTVLRSTSTAIHTEFPFGGSNRSIIYVSLHMHVHMYNARPEVHAIFHAYLSLVIFTIVSKNSHQHMLTIYIKTWPSIALRYTVVC